MIEELITETEADPPVPLRVMQLQTECICKISAATVTVARVVPIVSASVRVLCFLITRTPLSRKRASNESGDDDSEWIELDHSCFWRTTCQEPLTLVLYCQLDKTRALPKCCDAWGMLKR